MDPSASTTETPLIPQKQYYWKDSNLALFGSDVEKNLKKKAAETEHAWQRAGQEVGLQIWRVEKFKINEWKKEDNGEFFEGDAYIVLNTWQEEDELNYDVHCWVGSFCSQDEYAVATYKMAELDTYLDDKPVQHREVQGHESGLFKSYFPKGITLMRGGSESGFRKVEAKVQPRRLLQFKEDGNNVVVKEVPIARSKLDSSDVFVLDLGLEIYQWNGQLSSKSEKFQAMAYIQVLRSDRGYTPRIESLEEGNVPDTHSFWKTLEEDENQSTSAVKQLYKLSDASGAMEFTLVKEGKISIGDFDTKDVFIFDTGSVVFVWIGDACSEGEKDNGLVYAHNYLRTTTHQLIPVTSLQEGHSYKSFEAALTT